MLLLFGRLELIAEYLDVIAEQLGDSVLWSDSFYSIVSTICCNHGWSILKPPLKAIFENKSCSIKGCCQFLTKLTFDPLNNGHKDLCQYLAAIFVNYLVNEQDACLPSNRSKEIVSQLVNILKTLECEGLLASFVDALCSKPVYYPVLQTLGPAILDISKTHNIVGPLQVLLNPCTSTLEDCISNVRTPTNFVHTINLYCTCKDCVELKQFMQHPDIAQCRFRFAKTRKHHLEWRILIT